MNAAELQKALDGNPLFRAAAEERRRFIESVPRFEDGPGEPFDLIKQGLEISRNRDPLDDLRSGMEYVMRQEPDRQRPEVATIPDPEQVTAAACWLTVCGERREYPQGTPLADIEAAINEILAADGRPELRAKMVRKWPDRYQLEIKEPRRVPSVAELNALIEHDAAMRMPAPTGPWWGDEDSVPNGIKGVSYPPPGKGKRAQRRMSKPWAGRK